MPTAIDSASGRVFYFEFPIGVPVFRFRVRKGMGIEIGSGNVLLVAILFDHRCRAGLYIGYRQERPPFELAALVANADGIEGQSDRCPVVDFEQTIPVVIDPDQPSFRGPNARLSLASSPPCPLLIFTLAAERRPSSTS